MSIITNFEKLLGKESVKRLLISFLIGIATVGYASEYSQKTHNDIAASVVRFHVIAHSDSEYDQSIKLKVRDGVTEYLKDKLDTAKNVQETKDIINSQLDNIKNVAQDVLQANNCSRPVTVVTGEFDFPTKEYGVSKLPTGKYYALRITIGDGAGQNWWCVVYPDLCFGAYEEQKLKNVLTDDAYNIVTDSDGNIEYKFKFKLLELFGK